MSDKPFMTSIRNEIDFSCTPQSNHTLLFAYSNDLEPYVVQNSIQEAISWTVNGNYSKFGGIRFDTRNAGSFYFFNDQQSLNQSVNSNLPNPSLSNNQTGSDILNVLQRFLENTDGVPLCGSLIIILLKRHPLETDTSNLLAHLQHHHIFINTVMSNTPILGENYQVMYNLSGLTNGIAGFVDDQYMNEESLAFSYVLNNPFQIYSINPICKSEIERVDLPKLRTPQSGSSKFEAWFEISVQDHGPIDKFRSFNLTLTNTMYPFDRHYFYRNTTDYRLTNDFWYLYPSPNATYSVRLRMEFSDGMSENLQIRIWTHPETRITYWLPFTNWN